MLLFTVFVAATFGADAQVPLFGQAGRQVFFILTSIYGWWRWRQAAGGPRRPGRARRSRRAGRRRRSGSATSLASAAGILVLQWVFSVVGAGWPAPRWYFWCDAWIFVGSMLATYAMARGWNDFWLAWIAVDVVGVPLLLALRSTTRRRVALRRLRRPGGLGLPGVAAGVRASTEHRPQHARR